ncbi:MAG TPA: hypothetical protein VFC19_52345 [Candidatus Limnocylindrales bacterium]|nr:hypothetical protein [Candidatus Limnocylindrales bacterium]
MTNSQPFHGGSPSVEGPQAANVTGTVQRSLSYRFTSHFHPYVRELIRNLVEKSVAGLQASDDDYRRTSTGAIQKLPGRNEPYPVLYDELFTANRYQPGTAVSVPYPVKEIDFTAEGAYSIYNWELFYHVPITIGIHLSRNQRFADAQRWFHYVFDPTDASGDPTPDRFWKVRRFHQISVHSIEDLLINLATDPESDLAKETVNSINAWADSPFRPHLVAGYRQSAYMIKVVTAYLDNLIGWGDSLFRQDTGEAINEAAQLYILAANLLGPRPQEVPRRGSRLARCYETLRPELDGVNNTLVKIETDIPHDLTTQPPDAHDPGPMASLFSIGSSLYFAVPRNDKLLGYWDTVADRLFKIRNSLSIEGVFRQLPLFDPPIDPALLAKAAAAGLDVATVVAGLNQPVPLVRFTLLVQKASEICQQVMALGNQFQSAIEKEDAEALALLRARHETALLDAGEQVRYAQYQEAIKNREGAEQAFASAKARHIHYERMLGRNERDIQVPELDSLDADALAKLNLNEQEPRPVLRPIPIDIAGGVTGRDGGNIKSSHEKLEEENLLDALIANTVASGLDTIGAAISLVPQVEASAKPLGIGASVRFGGTNLSNMISAGAAASRGIAAMFQYEATMAAKADAYTRREQEWAYQSNLALNEIGQIYKQWRAAQIREALANRELINHRDQMKRAREVEMFLNGEMANLRKTTTTAFFAWLRREVRALYAKAFDLAHDVARKAERALQHELGDPNLSFLRYNYNAGKEGLLAGESLWLDIKRMEMEYHQLNQREYELTKHVSLQQLDPVALLSLRSTGSCQVTLPEELFDLDCPGHYFRRIKTLAVSVPCVVGPYTSLNCTLTAQSSTIRISPQLAAGQYVRDGDDTERFSDHFGQIESIVTSSGTNDSGLFDVGGDRLLPFEGIGAVSTWRLEIPSQVKKFDHETIVDVVLHVRYTAREGGAPLRAAAEAHLKDMIADAATVGSTRVLSLRRDFPTAWAAFTAAQIPAGGTAPLTFTLREEHYPSWAKVAELRRVEMFARPGAVSTVKVFADAAGTQQKLQLSAGGAPEGLIYGKIPDAQQLPAATGTVGWHLDDNGMADLWLALTWGEA